MNLNPITCPQGIARYQQSKINKAPQLKTYPPKDTVHFGSKKAETNSLKTRVINGFKKIGNEPWVLLGGLLGITISSLFLGPIAPVAILTYFGASLGTLFLMGAIRNKPN